MIRKRSTYHLRANSFVDKPDHYWNTVDSRDSPINFVVCMCKFSGSHGADLIVVRSCTGRTSGYVASILCVHDKAGTLTVGSCKELCMVQLRLKITKQKTVAKATCTVCDSVLYQTMI